MLTRFACITLLLTLTAPAHAARPEFWSLAQAREFLEGELEGLSVDSDGRLRLSPAATLLHETELPHLWCLVRDKKNNVYVGTGNEGQVLRIKDGEASVFFDAPELEVHALALGPDGRLYAGTSPDGKVYAIKKDGSVEEFFDPADKYIWSLVFDDEGRLLVATGIEGKLHRVDKEGNAEVLLTSPETHLVSLARDASGNVLAGSSPSGIVYRVDPAGKVFVLLDSDYREIKALAPGSDGSVYVAAIDGEQQKPPQAPAPTAAPAVALTTATEVTVTASAPAQPVAPTTPPATPPPPAPGGKAQGAVLRIHAGGEVERLWASSEEMPHSLIRTPSGCLVGTGKKGRLYRVHDDRTWEMLATFPAEQVTGLGIGDEATVLLATSNPGKLHALDPAAGVSGTFSSKVKDTATVSGFGMIRWEASGAPIQIQTRSGNTQTPDSTWSDWSSAYASALGDAVSSPNARFLQVRATLEKGTGPSPVLESITTAYLQRNLRPQVHAITVHPSGLVFQRAMTVNATQQILGLDPTTLPRQENPARAAAVQRMPQATAYSRRLHRPGIRTFSWKADDPNKDKLAYDVSYRAVGDRNLRLLRDKLNEKVVAWDTTTVPNGRYVLRVTATDAPSNPQKLALSAYRESESFQIDNTPPLIETELFESPTGRIRATVRDADSLVAGAEFSLNGGPWQEVYPSDSISDSREETYDIEPGKLSPPGPHLVVVRARDQLGNIATAQVEIP